MPLNVGSNLSSSRVSFGPAVIAIGAAGTTPSTNIGFIGDDAVEVEWNQDMGEVTQGNPKIPFFQFAKAQNFFLRFTSIEWGAYKLSLALGTGVTTISGSNEVMDFGGAPCPTTVAIHLQHRKCTAAHTVNLRVWTAGPENGSISTSFGEEVHAFPSAFKALRSATDWAGGTLADTSQLVQLDIQLT